MKRRTRGLPLRLAALCTLLLAPLSALQPTPPTATAVTADTIEDNFTRPNQTGWGTSTNPDGVPNVTWGMDGDGTTSYVTISNNAGVYGYPGNINMIGIASSGSTTYNGGDSLVKFEVSAVGHVTPYVVQNACPDKSCYYGARLHTSQNTLELAKRTGGGTGVLASVPFTPTANTFYWMRLDVVPGTTDTLRAKVWADGTNEPSAWMVTATDSNPLAANLVGTGGSWDQVGTGETIQYTCYAFATSGLAAPCSPARPTPGSGAAPWDTFTTIDLGAGIHLRANAANGNLPCRRRGPLPARRQPVDAGRDAPLQQSLPQQCGLHGVRLAAGHRPRRQPGG